MASRAYKSQMLALSKGLCARCGKRPRENARHCEVCKATHAAYQRNYRAFKRYEKNKAEREANLSNSS